MPNAKAPGLAVGGGVGDRRYHRGAGGRIHLLEADDVHDALTAVVHAEVRQAEVLHVLLERHDLEAESASLMKFSTVSKPERSEVDVVVHGHERAVGAADDASGGAKSRR